MKRLIDAAINRTRTTLLIMFMVVFAGLAARNAIPIAADPHVEVPFFVAPNADCIVEPGGNLSCLEVP